MITSTRGGDAIGSEAILVTIGVCLCPIELRSLSGRNGGRSSVRPRGRRRRGRWGHGVTAILVAYAVALALWPGSRRATVRLLVAAAVAAALGIGTGPVPKNERILYQIARVVR